MTDVNLIDVSDPKILKGIINSLIALADKGQTAYTNLGNGAYTVGKSVPSDAVFTDTTYVFGTAYNPVTNKAATLADITSAISESVTTALNTPV